MTSTTAPARLTVCSSTGYSYKQFEADMRKSRKRLDAMARKALREHAAGKTRKFP